MGKGYMNIPCTILLLFPKSEIISKIKDILVCFLMSMGAESLSIMLAKTKCSNSRIRLWFKFPLCSSVAVRTWVNYLTSFSFNFPFEKIGKILLHASRSCHKNLDVATKGLSSVPVSQQSINDRFYYFLNSFFTHTKALFIESLLCTYLFCKALFKVRKK